MSEELKTKFNEFMSDWSDFKDHMESRLEEHEGDLEDFDEELNAKEGNLRKLQDELEEKMEELDKLRLQEQRPSNVSEEDKDKRANELFGRRLAKMAEDALGVRTDREELEEEDLEELYGPLENIEKRALVENATGQNLVPAQIASELITQAQELSVVRSLVSSMTTSSNRTNFNKLTGSVTYTFGQSLEEGGSMSESTPSPSQDTIYIEDAMGLAKIGENELMDADYDLAQAIQEAFVREKATTDDTVFVTGSGHSSHEPEGLQNVDSYDSDYQFTVGTSATLDFGDLVDLTYGQDPSSGGSIELKDVYRNSGVFLISSDTERRMMQQQIISAAGYDGSSETTHDGPYMWQPSVVAGTPNAFRGRPVYTTSGMEDYGSAGNIVAVFGDLEAAYRVVERMDMTVKVLEEKYAEAGMIGYRFKCRLGGGIIQPEAIRILEDK